MRTSEPAASGKNNEGPISDYDRVAAFVNCGETLSEKKVFAFVWIAPLTMRRSLSR